MVDIHLRKAEERDVSLLTELSRLVHDMHVDAHPSYFKPFEPRAIGDQFLSRLRNPRVCAFIASIDDSPVGYVVQVLRERAGDARCLARRTCEIEEIAVEPDHRCQGVAQALIERVHREAGSLGIDCVELSSWSFNATAHAAFEALGFRPICIRFRYQSGHGE